MKMSQFALFVNNYPTPAEHLLFNTMTQAIIKIDQPFRDVLDRLGQNQNGHLAHYSNEIVSLRKMGLVVENEAEDKLHLDRYLERKKYGIRDGALSATVLTTYNCNLACTYCFEESTRENEKVIKLDIPTSDLIIGWLRRRAGKFGYTGIFLVFYGGEPLLNRAPIEHIAGQLKPWCEERGLRFNFCLQTNGVLLKPELVDKYVALGMNDVRITLDGFRDTHDKNRPVRGSGKGSFDTIMENIVASADKVKIGVAGGYQEGNVDGVIALLDYFAELGIDKKLGKCVFSPIHPTLGPKGNTGAVQQTHCMSNYDTDRLIGSQKKVRQAMEERGYPSTAGFSVSMCPLERENGGVIFDSHGVIYKCSSMLGHPELAVGDVRHDDYNDLQKKFLNADAWKECTPNCKYIPICGGGCRLFSFFQHKDFFKNSCNRDYMDITMPEAVKAEYQRKLAERKKTKELSMSF